MARSFTKNVANYLSLGVDAISPVVNGKAKISIACWCLPTTASLNTSVLNSLLGIGINGASTTGLVLYVDATVNSNGRVAFGARSSSSDSLQSKSGSTNMGSNVWSHLGGVADYSAKTVTVYLNGSNDGSLSATFGATSYTAGTPSYRDMIGATDTPLSTTSQFPGSIAEMAIWGDDIGANGFKALASGFLPYHVRPDALLVYWPLWGLLSPEPDLFGRAKNGTITGTVAQANHAPVTLFTRKRPKVGALAAAVAASRIWKPLVITPPIPTSFFD